MMRCHIYLLILNLFCTRAYASDEKLLINFPSMTYENQIKEVKILLDKGGKTDLNWDEIDRINKIFIEKALKKDHEEGRLLSRLLRYYTKDPVNMGIIRTQKEFFLRQEASFIKGSSDLQCYFYNIMGLIETDSRNFDQALKYLEKAKDIAVSSGNRIAEIDINGNLLEVYSWQGDYDTSIKIGLEILRSLKNYELPWHESGAYFQLGRDYASLGEYAKSNDALFRAVEIYEELDDKLGQIDSLDAIASNKSDLGDYRKAIQYRLKALEIGKNSKDIDSTLAQINNNLGANYFKLRDIDKAKFYLSKAIEIDEKNLYYNGLIFKKANYASILKSEKKYDQALKTLSEIRLIPADYWDNISHYFYQKAIFEVYFEMKSYNKAEIEFKKRVEYAEKAAEIEHIKDSYFLGISLYKKLNKLESAAFFQKKYFDLLIKNETEKNDRLLYDKENDYLQTESAYEDLKLEAKNKEFFRLRMFLIGVVILFLIVITFILFSNRKSKLIQIERLNFEFREQNIRMHMQPHFLFNMLNSIQDLVESSSDKAIDAVERFAEIYKKILLGTMPYTWQIADELDIIHDYIELQKIRFEDKISFELSTRETEPSEVYCPSLMIFTTVENSVDSLLSLNIDGGQVHLEFTKKNSGYEICIKLFGKTETYAPFRDKLGLENTRKRLLKMYGSKAKLEINSTESHANIYFWISGRQITVPK